MDEMSAGKKFGDGANEQREHGWRHVMGARY